MNIPTSIVEDILSGITFLANNPVFALIWSAITVILGAAVKRYFEKSDKDKRRNALRIILINDINNDIHYLREAIKDIQALQFFRNRNDLLSSIYVDLLLLSTEELEGVLEHYKVIRDLTIVLQSTDNPTGYIPRWVDDAENTIALLSNKKNCCSKKIYEKLKLKAVCDMIYK